MKKIKRNLKFEDESNYLTKHCNTQNKTIVTGYCEKCKNSFSIEVEWVCGPIKAPPEQKIIYPYCGEKL